MFIIINSYYQKSRDLCHNHGQIRDSLCTSTQKGMLFAQSKTVLLDKLYTTSTFPYHNPTVHQKKGGSLYGMPTILIPWKYLVIIPDLI